jgi:hypothetical protein
MDQAGPDILRQMLEKDEGLWMHYEQAYTKV